MNEPSPKPAVVLECRQRVFENRRFAVYSDRIAMGELRVDDFLVVLPHNHREDTLAGVTVVPVRSGRILLLKHYRHPVGRYLWELPRGFIDSGGEPATAALRELTEETGLTCARENLVDLVRFYPEPAVIGASAQLFAATHCAWKGEPLGDEIGIMGAAWFTLDEVQRMLHNGSLEDGTSCVALCRYFQALARGPLIAGE